MALVGTFGEIVFEVSHDRVRTFDNFSRSGSGRWATHEAYHQKPLPEFLGPGQEEISFSIRLSAFHGVNPKEELARMRKMRDSGEAFELIIGGELVGDNLWILESLREQSSTYTGDGKTLIANAEITLKEYPRRGGLKR